MKKYSRLLQILIPTCLLLLSFGKNVFAQDSLRMNTGSLYSVKIIEITDTYVKYRTYKNPDGPLYTVSKSTIYQYKLEGKNWEYFTEPNLAKKKLANQQYGRNLVSEKNHYIALNLSDLIRTDLTVFYEFILPGNKVGFRIPVTYGFRSGYFNPVVSLSNPFGFRRNIVFKTGVDLRVYAGYGASKARFVFGPAVYYLRLNKIPPDYLTTAPDYMVYKSSDAMRIMFLAGIIIRPNDFIQFGFDGGLGGDIDFREGAAASTYLTGIPTVPKAQLNVHLGYRF